MLKTMKKKTNAPWEGREGAVANARPQKHLVSYCVWIPRAAVQFYSW